jgi:predicted GIY-YIG superfamily endonuclease
MKAPYRRMIEKLELREAGSGPAWKVYILECADGSFYTGITKDLERRLAQHQAGRAARYTRSRLPVVLRYRERCADRSAALVREARIKALSRKGKERLVAEGPEPG